MLRYKDECTAKCFLQADEVCSSLTFGTPVIIFYSPAKDDLFEAVERHESAFAALCQVIAYAKLIQPSSMFEQGVDIRK